MNKIPAIASLAFLAALTGCNQPSKPAEPAAGNLAGMQMLAIMKHGKATGTVVAIDSAKGKISLDHGEIVELGWPPMKMEFNAKPDTLKGIAAGDKVAFEIDWNGQSGEVTSIRPMKK
jgi:Cu/Ag efflux protein CusF